MGEQQPSALIVAAWIGRYRCSTTVNQSQGDITAVTARTAHRLTIVAKVLGSRFLVTLFASICLSSYLAPLRAFLAGRR